MIPEDLKNYRAPTAAPTLGEQLLIVAFLAAAFGFVSTTDTWLPIYVEAAEKIERVQRVLLEPSMQPASLEECQRAEPQRPRPDGVISFQNGELMPWHHRVCIWAMKDQQ